MNRDDQKFLDLVDGDWTSICRNQWELLTGILLDARTPLERLRIVLKWLKKEELLDFRILRKLNNAPAVESILRKAGYPWARQKSSCFQQDINFDLLHATYEQMDSIKGIGPKLASLWMRIMNPKEQNKWVVIDTHVRRWIRNDMGISEKELNKFSYEELATYMRGAAEWQGITVSELDARIVESGIRARLARRRKK